MATRRRDTAPREDKTEASSSHLKATPNVPSKTNNDPTAPKKTTPTTSLRPPTRSSTGVKKPTPLNTAHSKTTTTTKKLLDKAALPTQKTRTLASPSTQLREKTALLAQKIRVSTNPSLRPHDKTPSPAQKTHILPISSLRPRDKAPLPASNAHVSTPQSSSFHGKTTASQKVCSGKNPKPLNKDVGKHSSLSHATPVSSTLKMSNICIQEQETEKSPTSATKEQTTTSFQETVENTDIYENLPEVESLLEDQESFTFETVEQIIQVVSDDERDIVGLVTEDQEKTLDIVQTEAGNVHKEDDAKIVPIEPSPVLGQQEALLDIKTQESEEKPSIQEKLEEHSVHEIDSTNNITTSVADELSKDEGKELSKDELSKDEGKELSKDEDKELPKDEGKELSKDEGKELSKDELSKDEGKELPKDEGKEKEVEEVVVVEKDEEKEKVLDKKDEVAGQSEAPESVETKVLEVVEKPKQEQESKVQKQGGPRMKRDVVSNATIEETASKLRDQRRNRVRALAGAFESVISSQ